MKCIDLINSTGWSKVVDLSTLLIAITSLVLAFIALRFTKNQRDIQSRAEKQEIYIAILDILYYLKKYDDECNDTTDLIFKKLQKLKSITESAFSKEAAIFIQTLLNKMHDLPVRKEAFNDGIPDKVAEMLEAVGIDNNAYDALAVQYMEIKTYFKREAFQEFERLFVVK